MNTATVYALDYSGFSAQVLGLAWVDLRAIERRRFVLRKLPSPVAKVKLIDKKSEI